MPSFEPTYRYRFFNVMSVKVTQPAEPIFLTQNDRQVACRVAPAEPASYYFRLRRKRVCERKRARSFNNLASSQSTVSV